MYKKLSAVLLAAWAVGSLSAVEIDTALLDGAKKVRYIEDTSPVTWRRYNSGKQVRDMGRFLGKGIRYQEQVQKDPAPYVSGAPSYKYKAMRVYASADLPGADVIYIGKTAEVGTTKCLFRVVSGYIEKAYGIPMEKSDIIAEKVCWWNNNHYQDKDYFTEHFSPKVLEAFNDKTQVIGLAASYRYWSGKTRIVIPFAFVKETAPETAEPAVQQTQKQNDASPSVPKETADSKTPATATASMPVNYKILFGILIAAAVLLVILLIKVIRDISRNGR